MVGLGINLFYLGAQIVNLVLLFYLLYRFLFRHAGATLEERRKRIEKGLEDAEMASKRAHEAEEAYQRRIEEAEKKAGEIVSRARREGEKLRTEILAEAREKSEQMLREAEANIEHRREQMMSELHRQAADLAIEIATKILGRSLDEQAHRRLIAQSLEELKA